MAKIDASSFETKLLRPAKPGEDDTWTFPVLPKDASDTLPRRGRTSVTGTINGYPFQATLDPDGQLSHWLRVSKELREAAWEDTTTIARLDWIHWIESAKQAKTRKRRVENACEMLSSRKKRICCFDQSGYYSKSLSAPQAAD